MSSTNSVTSARNPKFALASKYKGLESNVWVALTDLTKFKEGVVNLGQGFPDFQPAKHIIKYLADVCKPGSNYLFHQYARAFGHPRLVNALAALYGPLVGQTIDPMNEVLVTPGAYGSMFYAVMGNVSPGDEVIIIEPFFDCYEPLVRLAGGTPRFIPLRPTDANDNTSASWKLDKEEFEGLFNSKTKAIILNTPNNPLGKVFTREELTEISKLCIKFNVLVISDEVYEWIVYDENKHVRIASLEGMWERTITIGSAGKTFSLTGWKLGWAYGPKHIMENLQIAHQNCTYMCQTPEQEALGAALEDELKLLGTPESFFVKLVSELKASREILLKMIKDSGMEPITPQGGYFVMTNWKNLERTIDLSKETDELLDFRFVKWLAREKYILGIPPSAFYTNDHKSLAKHFIRFNFYKKLETLEKARKLMLKVQT